MNASWPRNIETAIFEARSHGTGKCIRARFYNQAIAPTSEIEIEGYDGDWVAARSKEIEEFISDHRNIHWLFNGVLFPLLHGLPLFGLIIYKVIQVISDAEFLTEKGEAILTIIVIVSGIGLLELYIAYMSKIFPFTFIDSERPSALATFRTVTKFAVPLILVGLIVEFIIGLLL